jgi:hypothetical protein
MSLLDESLLEILQEDFGLDKHWQWLYRVEGSPLWSITTVFLTKDKFLDFMAHHNDVHPRLKIVEFGKAKITKRFFSREDL